MERQQLVDRLTDILAILAVKIHIENSVNQNSVNIHAENLSINLLNEVYDCKLKNANYIRANNYPAIDLIDSEKGECFQITSTSSNTKIISTLEKTVKHFEKSKLKKLRIFILSMKMEKNVYLKSASKYSEIIDGKFDFDPEFDIIDGKDILRKILAQNDLDKMRRLVTLLEDEFSRIPTIVKIKYNVFVEFHPESIQLASTLCRQLIQAGIGVYTNSEELVKQFHQTNYQGFIFYSGPHEIPSHVHYTVLLITYNYLQDCKDKINYLVGLNKIIFPYIIDINIDSFNTNLNFQTPLFFSQSKINEIASNTIKRVVAIEDGVKIQDDVLAILRNFRPNDNFFKYGEGKTPNEYLKTENFDLFVQTTDEKKVIEYFAYIHAQGEKFNLNQVTTDLKAILKDKKQVLTILVPKAKHLKNPEKRRSDIEKKFPESNFYFVDDFAWQKCNSSFTQDNFHESFLMIENFVFPDMQKIDLNGKPSEAATQEDICNWMESPNEPTCVLIGMGGIGKTTVARRFSDHFLSRNRSVGVLFIEAENITSKLQQQSFDGNISLYSFYIASMLHQGSYDHRLSEEMFNLHFDNGKILIVIDGLDEVIARLPTFDINDFLERIQASTRNNGYGKVLITCRNYFWLDNKASRSNLFSIEILPFDEIKAKKFFAEKRVPLPSYVDKCMRISKSLFSRSGSKETYIPFMLDVVSSIVENQLNQSMEPDELEVTPQDLFQKLPFLDETEPNDFIILQLFEREIVKSNQIDSSDQFRFFIYLSMFCDGMLKIESLGSVFDLLGIRVTEPQRTSFYGHPLLLANESVLKLKYDFLGFYFQSLYFSEYFQNPERVFDPLLVKNYELMNYSYGVAGELANRKSFDIDVNMKLNIYEEIEIIASYDNLQPSAKRRAIGGIFSLCLTLLHKRKGNHVDLNTTLMKEIFGHPNGGIENLVISNIFNTNSVVIKFDFSNLVIKDAFIENYTDFWSCTFNDTTRFINSVFNNVVPRQGVQTSAKEANFINETALDSSFHKVLALQADTSKDIDNQVTNMFRLYMKGTFYAGGNFKIREVDFMKKQYSLMDFQPISFNKLLVILKQHLITEHDCLGNRKCYQIQPDKKTTVMKFCLENSKRPDIKKVVREIIEEI